MTTEELQAADTRLTRSFLAAVATWLATLLRAMFVGVPAPGEVSLFPLVMGALQIGAYVWYAIAAGAAARAVGAVRWHYVTWILAAPFLAMLPIPIVATLIGVSPLSIKFLLGGQLQTAMRQQMFADLHEGDGAGRNNVAPVG